MELMLTMEIKNTMYVFYQHIGTFDVTKYPKSSKFTKIRYFIHILHNVKDFRNKNSIKYPLEEVLVIAFFGVLSGETTYEGMVDYASDNLKYFKKYLALKNGIPSHDTIRRVFNNLDSNVFNKILNKFLLKFFNNIEVLTNNSNNMKHLAIDGKSENASGRLKGYDKEKRNVQVLNVFDTSNELCVYTKSIDKKTNEIPEAQNFLKISKLKNTLITADALHTQVQTTSIIKSRGGHYILGLKGNQSNASDYVKTLFDFTKPESKVDDKYYLKDEISKDHCTVVLREYYLKPISLTNYTLTSKFDGIKSVVACKKTMTPINAIDGITKTTFEVRYYVSSLTSINLISYGIRNHWHIENNLHWFLDTVMKEDDLQLTNSNAIANRSILNKFVLTILKLAKPLLNGRTISTVSRKFCNNLELFDQVLVRMSCKALEVHIKEQELIKAKEKAALLNKKTT
jgi:predicted transposase YbfD/YdcC